MSAAPELGPVTPDPHSPELKARCAGAVEQLLRLCVGQGRGREVAFDLLTETAVHHGEILARWAGRTNTAASLRKIVDRYETKSGGREFMRPASAQATLEALEQARRLMDREAAFWAAGAASCKVLSWSFMAAALERVAYQFGPAGAADVARQVLAVVEPDPIRRTAAAAEPQHAERRP